MVCWGSRAGTERTVVSRLAFAAAAGGCVGQAGFRQHRRDIQLAQHSGQGAAAGVPQGAVAPCAIAGEGVGAGLQGVHGPQGVVIEIVLVKGSAAALDGQHLLAYQKPPVQVLPGADRADLRHRVHGGVDQTEAGGRLSLGQGLQHHRRRGKPPLGRAGRIVFNGDRHRPLPRPEQLLPGEGVGGRVGLSRIPRGGAADQERGAERKAQSSPLPKISCCSSSAPKGG